MGRDAERELFASALQSADLPFNLLFIFGPGGVGKTTLLTEFHRLCNDSSTPVALLDGRNIEPSPDPFTASLSLALNLPPTSPPHERLASRKHIIILDTFELLAPLDNWLRDTFLPSLPEHTLTVVASRNPPSTAWRSDPGWQDFLRILPLRNLAPHESRAYLSQHNIPDDQIQAVLNFTHGHPLALSLVADEFAQRPGPARAFQPEASPDVIKALLERFVQKVPGPAHRAALEACALVRLTTEPLLAQMLGAPDAHELFEWLRELSFVELSPEGLFPHDLAREALAADVRWRNPDWYAELHKRARGYYITHIQQSPGPAQQRLMFDYVFLHRDSPVVRPFVDWQTSGGMLADSLRDSDIPAITEMVLRHEGEDSAQIASHWMNRQPQGIIVLRDSERRPAGFAAMVSLSLIDPSDREADSAARSVWAHLQRHAPLRSGETATLFRFWMGRDTYQTVSPAQSIVFINAVLHYLTTPGLVFTFFPCAEPEFWAPMFAYADLARLPDADFEVGGRRYGMYGHNWRAVPPMQWLALLAEREIAPGAEAAPHPSAAESIVVLSEPDFAAAVRDALRDYTQPSALQSNPLVQSRLTVEAAGANAGRAERAAALQKLIQSAAESLQSSPREMKLYRALRHTYSSPPKRKSRPPNCSTCPSAPIAAISNPASTA